VSTTQEAITCQELVELVTAYLEDALDAGDRARFEDHLGLCEGCTIYVEQMRTTIRLSGMLTPEALSPEAERDLMAAFRGWNS
jgi:predicted anti-sigma-YlaC factor YlaD